MGWAGLEENEHVRGASLLSSLPFLIGFLWSPSMAFFMEPTKCFFFVGKISKSLTIAIVNRKAMVQKGIIGVSAWFSQIFVGAVGC